MKNNKIVILIAIGIIVVTIGVFVTNNQESNTMEVEDTLNRELSLEEETMPEIQESIDKIEKNNLENEYSPSVREWITSGPFQIDRTEYVLGEKIFLRIGGLNYDEKGQVIFLRPVNSTDFSVYGTPIPFDGAKKPGFNYYVEPQLSKTKGHCTTDDFVGDWKVVFRGTNYKDLKFKITEDVLPGTEESYKPVC